nr:PAC2 family protein [Bacteroides helcogenes]
MKKFLFILTVIACFLASSAEARRVRIKIPVDNSIPKVATLPDSSYYKTDEGRHLDLGYIEEDGKRTLVLFSELNPDTYYDISEEYAEAIRRDLNVEELGTLIPKPTFWDQWGGRILFYGIAALVVIGVVSSLKNFIFNLLGLSKKKEEEE